ncbi:methyl-accepting chemotaxis protein, partial [Thermodesulfobacteriota bacterium]
MKQMKLGTKIIGLAVSLLILLAVVASYSIIKVNDIGKEIKEIAEEDIPLTEKIAEVTTEQLEQAIWFERALRFGEVLAEKETAAEGLKAAEHHFEELSANVNKHIVEAEQIAEHAMAATDSQEVKEKFTKMDEELKAIEGQHAQ